MIKKTIHLTYKLARRITVAVVGSTVLAIGVVMIVTPGPALVIIPIGLAILSIEFAWARLWLRRVRRKISEATSNSRGQAADNHRDRAAR